MRKLLLLALLLYDIISIVTTRTKNYDYNDLDIESGRHHSNMDDKRKEWRRKNNLKIDHKEWNEHRRQETENRYIDELEKNFGVDIDFKHGREVGQDIGLERDTNHDREWGQDRGMSHNRGMGQDNRGPERGKSHDREIRRDRDHERGIGQNRQMGQERETGQDSGIRQDRMGQERDLGQEQAKESEILYRQHYEEFDATGPKMGGSTRNSENRYLPLTEKELEKKQSLMMSCDRPHERYEPCFAGCATVSCDNPRDRLRPCYPFCEAGCVCIPPFVRDDRTHKCVMPDDCTKGLKGIPDFGDDT